MCVVECVKAVCVCGNMRHDSIHMQHEMQKKLQESPKLQKSPKIG